MLHFILNTFSEISLILGIIHLCILHFFEETSPKKYSSISRNWLIISLLFSIIFHNENFNILYFENNAYTLLFKIIISILSYILLLQIPSWFALEKETGCKYYAQILMAIATINAMISSTNLLTLFISYTILIMINYRLLCISTEKVTSSIASKYFFISCLIISLFLASVFFISYSMSTTPTFSEIGKFCSDNSNNIKVYLSIVGIIVPFLYSLGIAPFHIFAEEKSGKSILPVAHYFALITPIAFWGVFLKLNIKIFSEYMHIFSSVYLIFGIMSLFFGAVGANSRINLHRIFAHASIYHFGIILIMISFNRQEMYFSAFVYLFMYILALNGIYLVLYSLRSHGEYLSSVTSLSGLSQTRSYSTGMLLISIFSFIGFPPLAGFLGQLNLLIDLISNGGYMKLGIIFFCFLFLARAYLALIKIAYFEPKAKNYDTMSKSLLLCMLINMLLILVIAFNPYNIITTIQDMFYVMFL